MKRLIALLLAALLLAGTSAWAEELTLDQKFARQVQESAFKGSVTFTVSGNATKTLDSVTWAALKTLAPRLSIETDHSYVRAQGGGQATMSLLLDGENAGKTTLLYNDSLAGLTSEVLTAQPTWYAAARTWDVTQLFQSAIQGNKAWPPIWRVLWAVHSAPEAWRTRAEAYLTPYETKLGVWMSGYVKVSSTNNETTELHCLVPAQALKAEIKQLMVDFYADSGLLSLLREIVTAKEASAYLQPAMRETFFSLLDQTELEGDIEIIRRYDTKGEALLDQISLPFAKDQALSHLTISVSPDAGGEKWEFLGQTREGVDFDFTCIQGKDLIFSGSAALLLPAEKEDTQSFVVVEGEPERQSIAFDYNFSWDPGEEKYTLTSDRFERTMKGTLLIKPQHSDVLPNQTVETEIHLSSGSSQRSATRLEATLTWRDLDTDASVTAALSGRTAAPFTVETLNGVSNAVRVDLLSSTAYPGLVQGWQDHAQTWLQGLMGRLLPGLGQ